MLSHRVSDGSRSFWKLIKYDNVDKTEENEKPSCDALVSREGCCPGIGAGFSLASGLCSSVVLSLHSRSSHDS